MFQINKTEHNWLIKKTNNDAIERHRKNMVGRLYDLGCGTRPYEEDILKNCSRYIGVDWSNTLHDLSADIVANLNQPLPIADSTADSVVSFQVLEHLCEPQTMLDEAFRILRPEGMIFISVPFQWWVHEAPWDYFRYTKYGLQYILEKAGFVDIQVEANTGFWSTWFLKLNYQTTRLIRGPKPLQLFLKYSFVPLWWLNQTLAPLMDRYWPSEEETAVYFACARKPQAGK